MRKNLRLTPALLLALFATPCFAQAPAAQPEEKTIAVFGQAIKYWDVGSGPVVVLVHGLGSAKDLDWGRVVAPLSQKYRLLVPDQIGFGHSDKPLLDYKIQTYVDFLNEFLRELKIERASLVGESLGGWISALYVVEASGGAHLVPVQNLVLVDAAGLQQDKPLPNLNPSTLADMRKLMEAVFYDTRWRSEPMLQQICAAKLAKHDGYTGHTIPSTPGRPSGRLATAGGKLNIARLVVGAREDAVPPSPA